MPRNRYVHVCTNCGHATDRDKLTVKKVAFKRMGSDGKLIRSRVVAWLCRTCLAVDYDYNIPEMEILGRVAPGQ